MQYVMSSHPEASSRHATHNAGVVPARSVWWGTYMTWDVSYTQKAIQKGNKCDYEHVWTIDLIWFDLMFRFWHWWLKDNETAKTTRLDVPHVSINFFNFVHSLKQRHSGRPRLARSFQNGTGIPIKSELVLCSYDQKEPCHCIQM